jgi:hypothetical protein
LDGIGGAIRGKLTLLAIADVANLAELVVVPRNDVDAYLRVCYCLGELVAADRGYIAKSSRGVSATPVTTAARLHIRMHAIEDMPALEGVSRGSMESAEATCLAAV